MHGRLLLLLFPSAARSHPHGTGARGWHLVARRGHGLGGIGDFPAELWEGGGGGQALFVMGILWAAAFCNLPGSCLGTGPTADGLMPRGPSFAFAFSFSFRSFFGCLWACQHTWA